MSNRSYRTILGLILLVVLYFDFKDMMIVVIGVLFFEGFTNYRIPKIACLIRTSIFKTLPNYEEGTCSGDIMTLDAERIWRIAVGSFLLIGYFLVDALWFFPWFMGFAIFGAGLSGVCPVLFAIRWIGFK